MADEGSSTPAGGGVVQDFQQAKAELTGRQTDRQIDPTQESAFAQLESYTPHYSDYSVLREAQREQASPAEAVVEESTVRTPEQEPVRPAFDQVHNGDLRSIENDRSELPPREESPHSDREAAGSEASVQGLAENDRVLANRIRERLLEIENKRDVERREERER